MNLEDIALMKIAVTLWTSSEQAIELLNNYRNTHEWLRVTNVLCDYTNTLLVPEVMKAKIKNLLSFISFEIFKFTDYLSEKIFSDNESLKYCLSKLFWKTKGVIDRKKTVKKLIGDLTLSLSTRYELARVFCFEEDISNLWSKLPVDEKSLFLSIDNQTDIFLNNITIWSLYNGNQEIKLSRKSTEQGFESVSEFEFVCSVQECVPEAAVYYFKKIPAGRRRRSIYKAMNILQDTYYNIQEMCFSFQLYPRFYNGLLDEIVVFLFTETDNESVGFFAVELDYYNSRVVECFLERPFSEFFLIIFEKLQPHFKEYDYINFMNLLENKIFKHCALADYSYLLILEDVWKISSKTNKESVYSLLPLLLSTVLHFNYKKLVLLILNDLRPAVRETLLFTDEVMDACIELVNNKNWNLFEIMVNMCMTEEKHKLFKSIFGNRIIKEVPLYTHANLEKVDFESVFHAYNVIENVIKKRVINDTEYLTPKRLCRDL